MNRSHRARLPSRRRRLGIVGVLGHGLPPLLFSALPSPAMRTASVHPTRRRAGKFGGGHQGLVCGTTRYVCWPATRQRPDEGYGWRLTRRLRRLRGFLAREQAEARRPLLFRLEPPDPQPLTPRKRHDTL